MASSNRIPPAVGAKSAELLERAYGLDDDEDTRRLYRDWAETYDNTMLDGLGYLSPRLISQLLASGTRIAQYGCLMSGPEQVLPGRN